MKMNLNLSLVATFVIAALSYNVANAKTGQPLALKDKNISTAKAQEDNVRIFVNNQQRSLYQIALLSGVSVTELREINKGEYDNIDIVKIGDSIVLPANSSLLPAEVKEVKKEDKHSYLPKLGSSDQVDTTSNDEVLERHIATALQTLGQQDWENMSADKVKEDLKNQSQSYAENYVRSQVHSQLIDPIRSAAQDFLGRFGTAQLQFDVSDQAKLNNVNVKLFSPWYDSDNMLLFSQLTYQEYEQDRRIGNFGIGQRWDVADKSWLLGYNVFFDHDFTRNHNRLGFGLEAWADYMKFAANYYTPLSDWKDSKDFDDYLERAARGFDVRFQGYLPSYPHLGGSLMFEQYFGDKVALFGKDNLQKDPYAVTVGVDYTPVPLFTIKGEHKQGEGNNKMAKVELTMNYRIGVPVKDQLDPNMVDVARSLKGSRYDLVDRNNFIVLEYKEKKFSVDLATLGFFEEGTVVPLNMYVRNAKNGISSLSWNNLATSAAPNDISVLNSDGGNICYNRVLGDLSCLIAPGTLWTPGSTIVDTANWSVAVPPYLSNSGLRNPVSGTAASGVYTFDVTLKDGQGREATSNTSWLAIKPNSSRQVILNNVSPIGANGGSLGSLSDPAPADGATSVFLQANLVMSPVTVAALTAPTLPTITTGLTGFHDYFSYVEHAITVSGPVTTGTNHLSLAPTPQEILDINSLYTAKSGSAKVTFVADNAAHQCPVTTPKCLLVKGISKTVGSGAVADDYHIELATNAALGSVDVSLAFSSYQASAPNHGLAPAPTTIHFAGGVPAKITVYNGGVPVGTANNSNVITMSGGLNVGDTYSIIVEDTTNTDITASSTIAWSLVGDNGANLGDACYLDNTILPGDTSPTGDDPTGAIPVTGLFDVSGGSSYTIPINPLSYADIGTSINGNTVGVVALSGSLRTANACAGDQGFKLRIDVQ